MMSQTSTKPPNRLYAVWSAMRPHQWVKNLLVFVPILTADALDNSRSWIGALMTFCAFSATASAIYVVNDLCDLEADRQHPRKRQRPFASGVLSMRVGAIIALLLFLVGMAIGLASGVERILLVYATACVLYSIYLKHVALVDIFMLACLYTIRLFAGGVATGHLVSSWLLAFSVFIFLSLASIKRVAELKTIGPNRPETRVRGYKADDISILQALGIAASFASSVVLTLYVQSSHVAANYSYPDLLWGIVPVILFWQCRMWLTTGRGEMHDDPLIFAVGDRVSYLVLFILLGIVIAAR